MWVVLGAEQSVAEGTLKVFRAGTHRVAVSRLGGTLYAIDDVCTHDDGPLGDGSLDGELVECPRHGARFNVKTGAAVVLPAVAPVKVYPVRAVDGQIEVEVNE